MTIGGYPRDGFLPLAQTLAESVISPYDCDHTNGLQRKRAMQPHHTEFESLWADAQQIELVKGEQLFLRGDAPQALYWLEAGRLRLSRCAVDGSQTNMQSVLAGQTFAEASLFSQRYHCDCTAEEASRLRLLPRNQVLERLRRDGDFALALAQQLATQLRQARLQTELSHIRSAQERVLTALRLQSDDGGRVLLPGSWKDFAAQIGLTHEAVYRALAQLEKTGHFARKDRQIQLLSPL